MNAPAGGKDWPLKSLPQQATDPSDRRPQLLFNPASTLANVPLGGLDCP
jgi:hypothetical protein